MRKYHKVANLRPIRVDGDLAYIDLNRGRVAVIDLSDMPLVDVGRNWSARSAPGREYAVRVSTVSGVSTYLLLHRVIMNPPAGMVVDHIDGDGLNNRRSNLRVCISRDNTRNRRKPKHNTSGHMGVKRLYNGKWSARIRGNHIGVFASKEEAGAAYLAAAARIYGDFSPTIAFATRDVANSAPHSEDCK